MFCDCRKVEFCPSLLYTVILDTWPLEPAGGDTVMEPCASKPLKGVTVAACMPSKKTRLSGPKPLPVRVTLPSAFGVTELTTGAPFDTTVIASGSTYMSLPKLKTMCRGPAPSNGGIPKYRANTCCELPAGMYGLRYW